MSEAAAVLPAAGEGNTPGVPVRAIVRRFWPYLRPFLWPCALVLAASVAAPALEAAAVDVLRVLFFAGALFFLDWPLALLSLVAAPAFWSAARALSRRLRELSRQKRRHRGILTAVAEESLSNAPLVRAYGAEDF